jgi:hypothetical protein
LTEVGLAIAARLWWRDDSKRASIFFWDLVEVDPEGDHPPLGVLGHWSMLASFYAEREESFDGMRMADIMGCLYRRAQGTKMASKQHIAT